MPLVIHGYGARVLVEGVSSVDLTVALRAAAPAQLALELVDGDARADSRLQLRTAGSNETEILHDGKVIDRVPSGAALRSLCMHVELAVAVNARSATFVHAGAVGWRGVAVVVPGTSHTGKSRLVADLTRCGADYYSDEYAVIDESGRVHPYPRPIRLREHGEYPTPAVGVEPLVAALIVSTSYVATACWAPSVLRGARAVLPIIDNVIVVRDRPDEALRLAARLAGQVVTLQGPRPDAPPVAAAILEYLDRMLDGAETHAVGLGSGRAP